MRQVKSLYASTRLLDALGRPEDMALSLARKKMKEV